MTREKWQDAGTLARQCTNTYKQCRYMYIHCLYGVGVVVCRQPKEEKKSCAEPVNDIVIPHGRRQRAA